MKSSSTYRSYMNKMSDNLIIYNKLYECVEFTRLNFKNFNKNVGIAYDLFRLGYTESDGSTLTGDKIVNVVSNSSTIYSTLDTLASSLKKEITKAQTSYAYFNKKYYEALLAEKAAK